MTDEPSRKPDALQPAQPAELTCDEVETVLRRAAELQHRGGGQERMSLAEVEALAEEIGVSRDSIRRAYREVRSQALVPVSKPGPVERVLGVRRVAVRRVVPGPGDAVRADVYQFLRDQLFRIRRNLGDRTIWEPAEGLGQRLRRALDLSRKFELPTSIDVEVAIAETTTEQEVEVVLIADFGRARASMWVTAGTLATLGIGAGVGLAALATVWALPIAGLAGLGGAALSRRAFRRDVTDALEPLERLLDRLEHERPRPAP